MEKMVARPGTSRLPHWPCLAVRKGVQGKSEPPVRIGNGAVLVETLRRFSFR